MENLKRQQEIVKYLNDKHFASISELAGVVYTSQATVRRDVEKLEAKGVLKSVYGGVVITEYENEPVPLYLRDRENSKSKEKIAAAAAAFIKDNSTVILDSSSTVRRMCKYITRKRGLTVITNNLRVCEELKDSGIKVICTGGTLVHGRECFVGHFAEDFIRRCKADMLFFSSQGLSDSGEITDSSEEEIAIRKAMLSASEEKYFLCDSSKVGKQYPFVLTNVSEVTKAILEKEN